MFFVVIGEGLGFVVLWFVRFMVRGEVSCVVVRGGRFGGEAWIYRFVCGRRFRVRVFFVFVFWETVGFVVLVFICDMGFESLRGEVGRSALLFERCYVVDMMLLLFFYFWFFRVRRFVWFIFAFLNFSYSI